MSGWIQLHRSLRKWEWYTDINTCHLFIHLLLSANHKPTKWRGQDIKAGQLMTGRKLLSTETGLSEQQIRTSLKRLESTSEITITKHNKYSIITVTNWNQYQQKNDKSTSDLTNNQPAANQQLTTSNNINNINNENKITTIGDSPALEKEFDEFWLRYPTHERTKGSKHKALAKYKIARKSNSYDKIMKGLYNYVQHIKKTEERNADAFRWLNDKRWEDEYERELTREEREAEVQRIINQQQEDTICRLIS